MIQATLATLAALAAAILVLGLCKAAAKGNEYDTDGMDDLL